MGPRATTDTITKQKGTYNVTSRRVRATIVAVKSSRYYIFWVCVCSLRHPACNAHAPYCHLWPVRLYSIFFFFLHFLISGTIFGKMFLNIKCMFWFYLQLLYETFSVLRIIGRDMIKKTCIDLHVKYPLFLSGLNETWIFSADFRKNADIKFNENPSSGSWVVPCGRTDRWTDWQTTWRS